MRNKQTIEPNEPYFVHVGFTMVHERRKTMLRTKWKRRVKGTRVSRLYTKLKTRPVVAARIAKLDRYWRMSCM